MKCEADPRQRPIFCVILENIVNLRQKVRNRRPVRSNDLFFFRDHSIQEQKVHYSERFQVMTFFFKDHWILWKKSALLGMTSSNDFFFRDHCISGMKTASTGNGFK